MRTHFTSLIARALVFFLGAALVACGDGGKTSDPRFEVDDSLAPDVAVIQFTDDSGERPVASITDDRGRQVDFVEDEVILTVEDRGELTAIVDRLNATVLKEIDPTLHGAPEGTPLFVLVRIDPREADPEELRELILGSEGENARDHRVSSQRGLDTLTAMARESVDEGTELGANFLFTYDGLSERETAEAGVGSGGGYSQNAFELPYMNRGSAQDIGAAEAARMVHDAGRVPADGNKVELLIMDGGFLNLPDYPAAEMIPRGRFSRPNPNSCGGSDCFWHGTNVASAALGIFDDGIGAAGPASEVVRPIFAQSPNPNLWDYLEYIFDTVPTALGHFPEIVNISASGNIPAGLCLVGVCTAVNVVARSVRAAGILVFASAGNDSANVDAEDCFLFACWEEEYRVPCEAPGVICVGGLQHETDNKAGGSAYGRKQRESADSVDIYAPYSVFVHDTPNDRSITPPSTNAVLKSGTSFSSPFAAGIGALIKAANPSLGPAGIWNAMRDTAHSSSRADMHRWVNAFGAVHRALGDAAPPHTRILAPTATGSYTFGGSSVPLSCEVDDPDGMGDVEVSWTSSRDGVISDRASTSSNRLSEGEHTLTCTATDGRFTVSDSVTISVGNVAPMVTITNPDVDGTLRFYRGQSIGLSARVYDVHGDEDLSTVRWTASQDIELRFGGTIPFAYWDGEGLNDVIEPDSLHAGLFDLTVSVADASGQRSVDTIRIEIVENPPGGNLPPTVSGNSGSIVPVPFGDFDDPPETFWLDECDYDVDGNGRVDRNDLCQRIRFAPTVLDDHDAAADMTYEWTVQRGSDPAETYAGSETFEGDFEYGTYTVTVRATDSEGFRSQPWSWTFHVTTLI